MTKETRIRFLRIYGILLGIVIVIAGICLMAGCISIYVSGDQPYSREIVAEVFSKIAIPVYLCLAMIILGFVLNVILSPESDMPQSKKAHISKEAGLPNPTETKKLRLTRSIIFAVGVFFLVYGLMTGGVADVLAKAINICTECIGLG